MREPLIFKLKINQKKKENVNKQKIESQDYYALYDWQTLHLKKKNLSFPHRDFIGKYMRNDLG